MMAPKCGATSGCASLSAALAASSKPTYAVTLRRKLALSTATRNLAPPSVLSSPPRPDGQAALQDLDVAGRLRGRPQPEPGEPDRGRRHAAASVDLPAGGLARVDGDGGRRGQRQQRRHRGV